MRGASPSGSAAKPRLPPLFIFRPFAALLSLLPAQQFARSFRSVESVYGVCLSRRRVSADACFKTGTRLTTIWRFLLNFGIMLVSRQAHV